jgi:chemotaxis protein MotB
VDEIGVGNAMRNGPGGSQIYTPVPPSSELLPSQEFLDRELAQQISDGKLSIHMEARGMVVSLRDAGFFVSGSDELSPEIIPVLGKISETLLKTINPVRLEGHTDSIPIHSVRFRSNWELSTARGIATLEALKTRFAVPEQRMAVAGYADNFPVDTNDTPEGRAKNRRVDIVILSQAGSVLLPGSPPDTH